ncbi:hypothetical protein MKEN_00700300 [Mycena kentingensis (nom. inval.)]|nr:hypothetical protein MKEN_00700300 [Mycena kentingensis (nom. inval.)]
MAPSTVSLKDQASIGGAGGFVEWYWTAVIVQTFFFALYTLIVYLSTRALLERTLKSTVNKFMLSITLFMYILSDLYWIYCIANGVDRIRGLVQQAQRPGSRVLAHTPVTMWSPLFNSLIAFNYVISDGIVVWRAWIICLRNHRRYLWISIVFLAFTTMGVVVWIVMRIIGTAISPIENLDQTAGLGRAIDIIQVVLLFTSCLSNFSATGVVSATAWGHYKSIRAAFSREKANSVRTNRILLLIVETGVLYCFVSLLGMAGTVIRLRYGTLNDITMPVATQIAGAYPALVILLVSKENSLAESTFGENSGYAGGASTISAPIRFTPTPQTASTITIGSGGMSFAANPNVVTLSSFAEMGYRDYSGEEKLVPNRRPSEGSIV